MTQTSAELSWWPAEIGPKVSYQTHADRLPKLFIWAPRKQRSRGKFGGRGAKHVSRGHR